jgi:DNA-binding NtrC family response regulator
MLVSSDRRFRTVASALLERRGCDVQVSDELKRASETVTDADPDVVVLDTGSSGRLRALALGELRAAAPRAGLVLVGDGGHRTGTATVLPKWGVFEDLFSAIEDANGGRSTEEALVRRA